MSGKLPLKRSIKLDNSIHLLFEVPKDVKYEDAANWTRDHADEIIKKWGDLNAIQISKTKKIPLGQTS